MAELPCYLCCPFSYKIGAQYNESPMNRFERGLKDSDFVQVGFWESLKYKAFKLIAALLSTYYSRPAHYLGDVGNLVPSLSGDCRRTATGTATGLIRTGTQWTK